MGNGLARALSVGAIICLSALGFSSGIAVAQTLVVGNKTADTLGFIDISSGEMRAVRATGHGPHEVAISPDGTVAAVVSYGSAKQAGHTIGLFDVQSATPLKVIDLGKHTKPHGLLWMPDGERLVITAEGSGSLLLVKAQTGEIQHVIATGQSGSHMVALSPDARLAYISNLGSNSFTVIDLETGKRLTTIKAGLETEGIAVTPDGREIWVSNRAADTVTLFDADGYEPLAIIETGEMPIRVAISPDGRFAAVSNARDSTISVIDTESRTVIQTIPLSSSGQATALMPVTLLFSPDGTRLYAALTNVAEIAVIDTATWRQTGHFKAGAGSDGLGWSPLALLAEK
ncbi:YncE family protein [Iodidimonas gelatinilytica]|uniref:YncE family protein n=1 Tax=Iodidimonas gelatinilytica TaxID=1236966 RepID=UPI0012307005|nr:beta-propeller fold lactonase family protein [Iodidimonas gelatinilytica]